MGQTEAGKLRNAIPEPKETPSSPHQAPAPFYQQISWCWALPRGSSQEVSARCSTSTLSGKHPGAPDTHWFTKSQQRGFLWCTSGPAIQQRVTRMTPPWLLFPPEKHAARLTACQIFLAPQTSRAKNTPVSPSRLSSNCANTCASPCSRGHPGQALRR